VSTGLANVTPGPVSVAASGLAVPVSLGSASVNALNTITGQGLAVSVSTGLAVVSSFTGPDQEVTASGYLVTVEFGQNRIQIFKSFHVRKFRGGNRYVKVPR
jgi:hypothetical protein